MPQPHWQDPASLDWDIMTIAGRAFPAIVTFRGGVEADLEVKKAKGADKATVKDNGFKLADITVTLRLTTEQAWNDLQDLIPEIYPRGPGKKRNAVEITHPAINVLGLTRFRVKRIDVPQVGTSGRDHGIGVVNISLLEWAPAPKPVQVSKKRSPPRVRFSWPSRKARSPGLSGLRPPRPTALSLMTTWQSSC